MRFSLRTLLILTILGPPVLAVAWFNWDFTIRALFVMAITLSIPIGTVVAGTIIAMPAAIAVELAKLVARKFKVRE